MKKALKIFLVVILSLVTITIGLFLYYLEQTKNIKFNEDKLVNLEKTINFCDQSGNILLKESGSRSVTTIDKIPSHTQSAFIATEDKRFYSHKGIDTKGTIRAMFNNIKSLSFKEGGSTITQQLIKNTHLTNQKTLKRKLSEIKLSLQLEKKYSKQEILEKYLNTIYFGDNCYGITDASMHYFNKKPEKLNINESAMLAGIIKAPSIYSPIKNHTKSNQRKNLVLKLMFEQNFIDESTYKTNKNKDITIEEIEQNVSKFDFYYLARKELSDIIKKKPYWGGELNVYLTINKDYQKVLDGYINDLSIKSDKTTTIIDKNGHILAYSSTCGDIKRQTGSTLKPLISYAPAIEENIVYSCSPILDEKINFNGYSPSNYNDKYYGYVSVKDSLAKSLNSCSVKLLNYVGIEKAKNYLNKTDVSLTENDNSLCLALGATEKGASLIELCSAYDLFLNNGEYLKSHTINKIENNNQTIYRLKQSKTRVFSPETTYIVNDMLKNVAENGTAKKLSFTNIPICAKTGTVGFDNGNLDAYTISYNSDIIVGTWLGNKNNALMPNSISGGTLPCVITSEIWGKIYQNKSFPEAFLKNEQVIETYIDKIAYEKDHQVILSNEITPDKYKIKTIFKKQNVPKEVSSEFIVPKIENAQILLNKNQVEITLCLTEFYDVLVYKNYKNHKSLVFDSFNQKNKTFFIDKDLSPNQIYEYSIVPYYNYLNKKIYGKEIILNKIKTPAVKIDDWWENDL